MNVKVNDTVLVITGKYKGKQGKVLATEPKAGKVRVEGVNIQHNPSRAQSAARHGQVQLRRESPVRVRPASATFAASASSGVAFGEIVEPGYTA